MCRYLPKYVHILCLLCAHTRTWQLGRGSVLAAEPCVLDGLAVVGHGGARGDVGREREEDADEGFGLGGVDGQAGGVLHHLSDAAAYLCRRLAGGEEGEIAAKVFHIIFLVL